MQNLSAPFEHLEPQAVWRHFAALCAIPRPSKREARLIAYLREWAQDRGIAAQVDSAGNLMLVKPACPGLENAPGVVLQSHLDMVCQQTTGHGHDFDRDPIRPELENGWLFARHTTLGADNGIGVALALAALEASDLRHGPLVALLTVDEEAGMSGARHLEPGAVPGRTLLNLDTEEWGKLYLGCAGGVEMVATLPVEAATTPSGWQGVFLTVDGLQGGHSGIDIHLPRAHAVHLLFEILQELSTQVDFSLSAFSGGTASNALPRSAEALLALPPEAFPALKTAVAVSAERIKRRWQAEEPGLTLTLSSAERPEQTISSWQTPLQLFGTTPYGVAAHSAEFPGVVETSNNLSPFALSPQGGKAHFFVRSLKRGEQDKLAAQIAAHIEQGGGQVWIEGVCPPWEPHPDSALLRRCQSAYRAEFGETPKLEVIHAGLECGLFAQSQPHLEMLSFGPDIRGAHAPGERVNVASVERCWRLLTRLLKTLAETGVAATP